MIGETLITTNPFSPSPHITFSSQHLTHLPPSFSSPLFEPLLLKLPLYTTIVHFTKPGGDFGFGFHLSFSLDYSLTQICNEAKVLLEQGSVEHDTQMTSSRYNLEN
ncbi:hypothetical protein QVD17_09005 [Tagetes erecta]|uniref:Uncharacterized protein n=1 Tax=Tagetes erecta TaxID=13708 RepID=A0AAD8L0S0_TARER|nr:hypothetical protein QVD17_09005 [Tagetes erecta]